MICIYPKASYYLTHYMIPYCIFFTYLQLFETPELPIILSLLTLCEVAKEVLLSNYP